MTSRPIVSWCEIPVSDFDKSIEFYCHVFDYVMELDRSGPEPFVILNNDMSGVGAHLFAGRPAGNGRGPRIHLVVPDNLEAAIERCKARGGEVLSDPRDIPPGRFVYALDPDGNGISLFEPRPN
ncbi:VOC family protein [Roseibium sp.]|uniref:VOC family protein n=1 Tax=Roseibium sp. TaxID=1936156 RepID=UPI003BAF5DE8